MRSFAGVIALSAMEDDGHLSRMNKFCDIANTNPFDTITPFFVPADP